MSTAKLITKYVAMWFQLFLIKLNKNAMFITSLYVCYCAVVVATEVRLAMRTNEYTEFPRTQYPVGGFFFRLFLHWAVMRRHVNIRAMAQVKWKN